MPRPVDRETSRRKRPEGLAALASGTGAPQTRSYCYRNLHKDMWSIVQSGRVVGHAKSVKLINCELRVRPGGRERVLRERKKNVHAFVIGELAGSVDVAPAAAQRASYNPYLAPFFFTKDDAQPVFTAAAAYLTVDGKLFIERN